MHFDAQDSGEPLSNILSTEGVLFVFHESTENSEGIHGSSQSATETRKMGSSIPVSDVVCEAENVLLVAVTPLHGYFHSNVRLSTGH